MKTAELKIKGMHCKSCTVLIGDALKDLPGVEDASVDLQKGTAKVHFDDKKVSIDKIIEAVKSEGYSASK